MLASDSERMKIREGKEIVEMSLRKRGFSIGNETAAPSRKKRYHYCEMKVMWVVCFSRRVILAQQKCIANKNTTYSSEQNRLYLKAAFYALLKRNGLTSHTSVSRHRGNCPSSLEYRLGKRM